MTKRKKIELMAPAGSFSTLKTALSAGADAVYFGINIFSMRSGKKNFKLKDIQKIKKICNSYKQKPKMYLTLNTIVYDKELKKLEKIIKKIKGLVDAIICSDFAIIMLCKDHKIPFIISTQCSVSNTKSALFYKKLGAKRIVLARELNIKQIKEITKIKKLEIEVFAHGAMCVAVSGRCFMSQFLYNKSANRGECLHPCRRGYEVFDKDTNKKLHLYNNTIMSAKDLCTLPFIEELKKANINAIKIEGRNRDERYIDTIIKAYRKAINEKLTTDEIIELMKQIEKVFHRGFSSGFYIGKPLPQDFATVENSASLTFRDYIGVVTHFYPKINVVLVSLKKNLKLFDNIIFISSHSGLKEIKVKEMEIKENKLKIDKKQAGLLLAGVISDTLNLTSSTTTTEDIDYLYELKKISKIDTEDLAKKMFDAKSDFTGKDIKEIITGDMKEYNFNEKKVVIGVAETTSLNYFEEIEEDLIKTIKTIKEKENYDFLFFGVVDIINKNTYLYGGDEEQSVAQEVFSSIKEGNYILLKNTSSRKKEIAPPLSDYYSKL